MRNNKQKGFTLVELLVVIAILAILATVSVVGYTSYIEGATVRVDEDLAAQLTRFLEAYKVNHPDEITEDNIWQITQDILEESGINELNPKSGDYGHHFYFDFETKTYVVLSDEEAIDTNSGFENLWELIVGAEETEPKFNVRPGNFFTVNNQYFLVDTTGALAEVVNGFYTFDGTAADLKTFYENSLKIKNKEGLEINSLIDLFAKSVFATKEGTFALVANADHELLFVSDSATYVDNHIIDINSGSVYLGEDKYLLHIAEDDTIVIPSGVLLPAYSLNINAVNGALVTIRIEANAWTEDVVSKIDANFTNSNVLVELGGAMHIVYDNIVYVAEQNEDKTWVATDKVAAVLGNNFPLMDFNLAAVEVTNKTVNGSTNRGYLAWDKLIFNLSLVNVNAVSKTPASNLDVEWSVAAGYENYVEIVRDEEGNFVSFKLSANPQDYADVDDVVKVVATALNPYKDSQGNDKYATATFTVDVVRILEAKFSLGVDDLSDGKADLVCNAGVDPTTFDLVYTLTPNQDLEKIGIVLNDTVSIEYTCDHTHGVDCCPHVHDDSCDAECAHVCDEKCKECDHEHSDACCKHKAGKHDANCCTHDHMEITITIPIINKTVTYAKCNMCTHQATCNGKCKYGMYCDHQCDNAKYECCPHGKNNANAHLSDGSCCSHIKENKAHDFFCCTHNCKTNNYVCYTECTHVCGASQECYTCNHTCDDTCITDCTHKNKTAVDNGTNKIVADGTCSGTLTITIGDYKVIEDISVEFYDSFDAEIDSKITHVGSGVNVLKVEDLFAGEIPTDATIYIFGSVVTQVDENNTVIDSYMNPQRSLLITKAERDELNETLAAQFPCYVEDNTITYNAETGEWETIKFYGTRGTSVYIAAVVDGEVVDGKMVAGKRISEDAIVKVVEAKNVNTYEELVTSGNKYNNTITGSVVLLNDIRIPKTTDIPDTIIINNGTLYGNHHTFDITNGQTAGTFGIITLSNSNMQDTRVIGAIYEGVGVSAMDEWGSSAVHAVGTSKLTNCYIANCRAPLAAGSEENKDANKNPILDEITIDNCVFFGGVYCNIDIRDGVVTFVNKVITVNQPHTDAADADSVELKDKSLGLGITVWFEASANTKIVGVENLVQYNFIPKEYTNLPTLTIKASAAGMTLTANVYTANMLKDIFDQTSTYGKYYFTETIGSNTYTYVNAGILSEDLGSLASTAGSVAGKDIPTGDRTGFKDANGTFVAPDKYGRVVKEQKVELFGIEGAYKANMYIYGIVKAEIDAITDDSHPLYKLFDKAQDAAYKYSPWENTSNDVTYVAYDFDQLGNIIHVGDAE